MGKHGDKIHAKGGNKNAQTTLVGNSFTTIVLFHFMLFYVNRYVKWLQDTQSF